MISLNRHAVLPRMLLLFVGIVLLLPASSTYLTGLLLRIFLPWMPLSGVFHFLFLINGLLCLWWWLLTCHQPIGRKQSLYIRFSIITLLLAQVPFYTIAQLEHYQLSGPTIALLLIYAYHRRLYTDEPTDTRVHYAKRGLLSKALLLLGWVWFCAITAFIASAIAGTLAAHGMPGVGKLFIATNHTNWAIVFIAVFPVFFLHFVTLKPLQRPQ